MIDRNSFIEGKKFGEWFGNVKLAQKMRVILCALITAHKKQDEEAFWATVEIAKATIGERINFSEEEWAIFRTKN